MRIDISIYSSPVYSSNALYANNPVEFRASFNLLQT